MDDNGDSLWTKTYGSFSSDQGYYIRPTTDQGYISTSRLTVYQWGDQIYLMKLDQSGDTLWTRTYGTPRQDYGHSVIETGDGGYMIAGRTYASYTAESGDAWAIRTDASGDTLWTKKYGWDNDEDIFYCVIETEDGYLFAGQTRSFGPGYTNVYVVRTDHAGDTVWSRTYGGAVAQNCYAMHEKENGNYVLCGYTSSFSPSNDVYMLEIDPQGNMIWEDHWGAAVGDEYMYGCRPTSDGGYIITGWTSYYGAWDDELFALKLGESSGIQGGALNGSSLSVSPNPCVSATTIHIDLQNNVSGNLIVFNNMGQIIWSAPVRGKMDVTWEALALPRGLYGISLLTIKGAVTQRIVLSGY
jgi:hypothetical protein